MLTDISNLIQYDMIYDISTYFINIYIVIVIKSGFKKIIDQMKMN